MPCTQKATEVYFASLIVSCDSLKKYDLTFPVGDLHSRPLTFLPCWRVFVWWLLILLLAAQVTSIDRHGGFDLLLSQLHALIKHLEEFFGLVVPR